VAAESVDLTAAAIFTPPGISGPEAKAVLMLVEEVGRRSHVKWERVDPWPAGKPVIVVSPADGVQKLLAEHGVLVPEPAGRGAAEGYRIGVTGDAATPVVWIAGNDPRGTLFGVGRLLRELRIERNRITLPGNFREESAPRTPLRGHQL